MSDSSYSSGNCAHPKLEYLEWKLLEDRGVIVGNCVDCESTVSLTPSSILYYKDWEFTFEEAQQLMNHLMGNLEILESIKVEIEEYRKEGLLCEKDAQFELELVKLASKIIGIFDEEQ